MHSHRSYGCDRACPQNPDIVIFKKSDDACGPSGCMSKASRRATAALRRPRVRPGELQRSQGQERQPPPIFRQCRPRPRVRPTRGGAPGVLQFLDHKAILLKLTIIFNKIL